MAEVTPDGFVGKTENEYYDEERQLYLDIDPDWNLDPSTPDGLKLAHDAEVFAILDEAVRLAYNSKDPNRARDEQLDIISALTGTFRNLGTPSGVVLTLNGVAGTLVPQGSIVESTVDGSQWATDADVTLTGSPTAAAATCTVNGATQADIGSITRIVVAIGGWQSVINDSVATPGTAVQSNSSLRIERRNAVARPGSNQIDNLTGELLAVDGVRNARVYENYDDVADGFGRPPHSKTIIVDGGTIEDIGAAIYAKHNTGCNMYQPPQTLPVSLTVASPIYPWNTLDVKFNRPEYTDMLISMTIVNDGTLPSNAVDLIKEAILEYAAGTMLDATCGFRQRPYQIGEAVTYGSLYTPINHVIGEYGNSYAQLLTLNGSNTNIDILWYQLSRWTDVNIDVVII